VSTASRPKTKVTFYLDPEIVRMMRVRAARMGVRDSAVVEDALREHFSGALERLAREFEGLSEDEAEQLAYQELEAARASRQRGARRP